MDQDTVIRLRRVALRLARQLHAASTGEGLTPTQASVLGTTAMRGPLSLAELTEIEGLNPTMLSRVVGKLDSFGLIRRLRDPEDFRAARVEVTPEGRRRYDRITAQRTAVISECLAGIPAEQEAALVAALPVFERLAEDLRAATRGRDQLVPEDSSLSLSRTSSGITHGHQHLFLLLQVQERPLTAESSRVAGQLPRAADYPVAGDKDAQRVTAHRGADLLSGHRSAQSAGELAVACRLPVRNLRDQIPDAALELIAAGLQRQIEPGPGAGQVFVELTGHGPEAVAGPRAERRRIRPVPVVREVQADQRPAVPYDRQVAQPRAEDRVLVGHLLLLPRMTTPGRRTGRPAREIRAVISRNPDPGRLQHMTGKQPFEAVVAVHGPTVLRVCRAILGAADADDAWSETFLSAMKAYPGLPADANVEAWLVTIAHRKAIDVTRAAARRPIPVADPTEQATGAATDSGNADGLAEALARLPARQKQAVAYHYLAGLPYADIAVILGGSTDAARRAAADGIASLRRSYRPARKEETDEHRR
jgi:RNA polymerase sigma factor (sigma-70 family)